MKILQYYLISLYNWTVTYVINPVLRSYVDLTLPWTVARFYAAWEEYQKCEVYRERLVNFGFGTAFKYFFNSNWERNYHLKNRLAKEPRLAYRIRFAPWTIKTPSLIEIASCQGYFSN